MVLVSACSLKNNPLQSSSLSAGEHARGIIDFERGLEVTAGNDATCMFMLAICQHARGNLKAAFTHYNALLRIDEQHMGYCQRDWAAFSRYALCISLFSAFPLYGSS